MGKRSWATIAVLVIVATASLWGYRRYVAEGSIDEDAPETTVVARGTLQDSVTGTGSLTPANQVSVSFAGNGTVEEVFVEAGVTVEKGQPLAVLDTRDLQLALETAEANLVSAESSLSSAEESRQDLLDGPDPDDVEKARIALEQSKDRRWATQAQRDGICGRVDNGRGEQYECDSAEASVLQAEDAVRLAQIEFDEVLAGAKEQELSSARDQVAQAQSKVTTSRIQVEQARLALEEATLVSPMAGTVLSVGVAAGESTGSGEPAFTIGDLSALEVVISLDETDVAAVSVGQAAQIVLDAFPDDLLTGEVEAVAPAGEESSGVVLFPVTVAVSASGVPAKPGMTADVDIITMSVVDVLIIPLRAVVSTPNGDFVSRVVVDGRGTDAGAGNGSRGAGVVSQARGASGDAGGPPGWMGRSSAQSPGSASGEMPAAIATRRAMRLGAAQVGLAMSGEVEMVPVVLGAVTTTEVEVTSGLAEGDLIVVPDSDRADELGRPGGMPIPMGGGMFGGRP